MAAVLKSTGSALSTSDYGVVTSDTLAQTLLIDAYRKFDIPTRRKNNEELMAGIVSRLIGGGQLASKFRALAATSPGRHMLMYFRDKDLEALVAPTAMAGRLDPGKGDFIAVYTNNTNASKVDVYQARTVTQDVVYGADGSATVTRSVTISNNSPPYRGKTYARDPGEGYETTFSLPVLATYVPPGARVRGFEVSHSPQAKVTLRPYAEDKGMRVLLASANLPRSNSMTAKVTYLTRPQNNTDGYHLRIISQATLLPAQMTISVQPPPGAVVTPTAGWSLQGDRWTTTLSVTGDVDIVLPFTRG
jgi:hypothetical protein